VGASLIELGAKHLIADADDEHAMAALHAELLDPRAVRVGHFGRV
jgi:hypothetical protein